MKAWLLGLKNTVLDYYSEMIGNSTWKRNLLYFSLSFLYFILMNSIDGYQVSKDFTFMLAGGTELIEQRNPYSIEFFWKDRMLKQTNTPLICFIMIVFALMPNPLLVYVMFLGMFFGIGTILVYEFFDDPIKKAFGIFLWHFLPFHIIGFNAGYLDFIVGVLALASLHSYRKKDYDTSALLLGLSIAFMYSSVFIVIPILSTLHDRKTLGRYLIITALPLFLMTLPFLLVDPLAAFHPLLYQQSWNGRPPGPVWSALAEFFGFQALSAFLKTFWVPIVAVIILLFTFLDLDVQQKYTLPFLFSLLFMAHAWEHYYMWITLLLIIELISAKKWGIFYIQLTALLALPEFIFWPVIYRGYRVAFGSSDWGIGFIEIFGPNEVTVRIVMAMTLFGLLSLVSSHIREKECFFKDRKHRFLILLLVAYNVRFVLKLIRTPEIFSERVMSGPTDVDVLYSYMGTSSGYLIALFVLGLALLILIIAMVFYHLVFDGQNKTIILLRDYEVSIILIWLILIVIIMGGFLTLFSQLETSSPLLFGN